MARITVENCIQKVPNRFELILLAAHRSRELSRGDEPLVPRDRDKNPVVALREIASADLTPSEIEDRLVESMRVTPSASEQEGSVDLISYAEDQELDLGLPEIGDDETE